MDRRLYLIDLYDIYGELFNKSQRLYFESYYFDNLSLSEISENLLVSRNAVHKSLKMVESKLDTYESILSLYKKRKKLKNIIDKVKDEEIKKELEKISW